MKSPLRLPICFAAIFLCTSSCSAAGEAVPPQSPTVKAAGATAAPGPEDVAIPGPLRSFLRMAGLSQKISPQEVVPLLSRNVFLLGYQNGRPTEFLVLLTRYVHQAQELEVLAGSDSVIRVSNCEDAKPLLRILGYRVKQTCGEGSTSLVTANSERAFLTIDSGFPLSDLEESLEGKGPFTYSYLTSRVPVLFNASEWIAASKETGNDKGLVETLLGNRALARLYWALSRNDAETAAALRQSVGLKKLLPYASVLDFYGGHISIRSGHVSVPGGIRAEPEWRDLAGATPESAGDFIPRLLAKDKGWLAAYFDALSHVSHKQQVHFIDGNRLKRFYEAFRSADSSTEAARLAFRPAPALLLLFTRVQWEPSGEPHVPGNLAVWTDILRQRTDIKIAREWSKRAARWQRPDQLLEAMFAFSRYETETGPLQAYLFLSELDARRPPERQLSPQTALLLAAKFQQFSNQYLIFSEFPELSDASIARFLYIAESLGRIPNHTLRGNAMGTFEANVGLWQILTRQGQIASGKLNDSWQQVIVPFSKISSSGQLFDAGRNSLGQILLAASGRPDASQDEIVNMLAGPRQSTPEGQRIHQEVANRIRSVLDGQRLVSLDTLTALGDGLNDMSRGGAPSGSLVALAAELREFEMPRPIFTGSERTEWAAGTYNNRHTELQMQTDFSKVLKSRNSPGQLEEARGQLASFLRDTLVGLNYAYYEPPGAQVLHNNPLFVRSHDFSGDTVTGVEHVWQAPQLFGAGSPAGGGAHLIGSLADLPYALAEVEQDFIAPENVQALIWRELVPGLLTDATLPRWWGVSRNELHAIALYQRAGEELLNASVANEDVRAKVMSILSDRMIPQRLSRVDLALRDGRLADILPQMMPADTFYLTAEFRRRFPGETGGWGADGQELDKISREYPEELSWRRLSQDFGVPHPILAQSYARELLNVKPLPACEGYSSRLLAESWDSSNLYWARLADELDYPPVMLNRLVPQLTRRMVEKIFASEFEDWPAILRAMRETGDEFRAGKLASLPANPAVSRP